MSSLDRILRPTLLLIMLVGSACARPDAGGLSVQDAASRINTERDNAGWAELEAERRAADGDYDGAVQAHQQAEQDLRKAEWQKAGIGVPASGIAGSGN